MCCEFDFCGFASIFGGVVRGGRAERGGEGCRKANGTSSALWLVLRSSMRHLNFWTNL